MGANPVTGELSWQIVGTFGGCIAATMLIMRALSQAALPWLSRVPSIVEAYAIGALLLLGADVFLPPPPTASSLVLCLVNAFGIAIGATGGTTLFGAPVKPAAREDQP